MKVVLQKPTVAHLIKKYSYSYIFGSFSLLYICSLFNEAVNNSDHTELNSLIRRYLNSVYSHNVFKNHFNIIILTPGSLNLSLPFRSSYKNAQNFHLLYAFYMPRLFHSP
jgi:hypothetical protein